MGLGVAHPGCKSCGPATSGGRCFLRVRSGAAGASEQRDSMTGLTVGQGRCGGRVGKTVENQGARGQFESDGGGPGEKRGGVGPGR